MSSYWVFCKARDKRTWLVPFIATLSCSVCAQQPSCNVHSVSESRTAVYPPMARRAHVQGPVSLVVHFDRKGRASDVQVIDGNRMLQQNAAIFVRGWKAELNNSLPICQITITYHLRQPDEPKVSVFVRTGPQAGTITADALPPETFY